MRSKSRLMVLIVLTCVFGAHPFEACAAVPRFGGRVLVARGGTRIYRRALQNNQKLATQQMQTVQKMAAQEQAAAAAEAKRQHELRESGAAANREIKQREQERGERERKRGADEAGTPGSSAGAMKSSTPIRTPSASAKAKK